MSSALNSFPELAAANNLGAVVQFYFTPVGNVSLIPDPVNNIVSGITLVEGAVWYSGYMSQDSMSYSEPLAIDSRGIKYNASLAGFAPKDTPEMANIMNDMVYDRFVVLYKDANGYFKIAGSVDQPLVFDRKLATDQNAQGRNGYQINFSGDADHEAWFFTGTFPVSNSSTVTSSQGATISFVPDSGTDPLTNFPNVLGDNLPGVQRFYFAAACSIYSMPEAIDNIMSGNIELRDGATMLTGYLTIETISYTEALVPGSAGNAFNVAFTGFCPKDTPEMANIMNDMVYDRFIVMYQDMNGYFKIAGTVDEPLTFDRKLVVDEKMTGNNGYQLSFTGQVSHEAYFFTGTFPASSIQAPPVILEPPQATGPAMSDEAITAAQLLFYVDGPNEYLVFSDSILAAFGKLQTQIKYWSSHTEPTIAAGTTLQYWRGDKQWETLNTAAVPESSNLYYTDVRARASMSGTAPISYNSSTGAISMHVADTSHDGYLSATDWNIFNGKQAALGFTPENSANKGVANGYASLDSSGYVPLSQMNPSVLGALDYQGTWNANTNSPTLVNGSGTKGYYYKISVAGNTTIDTYTDWHVGDWIVFNGTTWDKVDNNELVSSVVGQTGAVTIAQIISALGLTLNATPGTFGLSSTGVLTFPNAAGSTRGLLSASDWTAFNAKQAAGNYIIALTGDVTATGPGSVTATVAQIQGNTITVGGTGKTWTFPNATGTVPLGTGTTGYVTYWSGTNAITGDSNYTWDATTGLALGKPLNITASSNSVFSTATSGNIGLGTGFGSPIITIGSTIGGNSLQLSVGNSGSNYRGLVINAGSGSALVQDHTDLVLKYHAVIGVNAAIGGGLIIGGTTLLGNATSYTGPLMLKVIGIGGNAVTPSSDSQGQTIWFTSAANLDVQNITTGYSTHPINVAGFDDVNMVSTGGARTIDTVARMYIGAITQGSGTTLTNTYSLITGDKILIGGDVYPRADNSYKLGKKNLAFTQVVLKDTTNGTYYKIEMISGVLTETAL